MRFLGTTMAGISGASSSRVRLMSGATQGDYRRPALGAEASPFAASHTSSSRNRQPRQHDDALVIDISIPVLDGLQTAAQLRDDHYRTKITFLTITRNRNTFLPDMPPVRVAM